MGGSRSFWRGVVLAAGLVAPLVVLSACDAAPATPARAQVTFGDLKARKHPKADARLSYGASPSQVVDLWLPGGAGPHPVVVMIHGGCWQADVAGLDLMDFVADDLRRRGIAVWNIEYRRIGEPGGGYPGTFEDTGRAIDLLGTEAAKYHLKLDEVVAVGHSAGGHLALWAAGRASLPKDSPLHADHPQKIDAVIGLGALGDLVAARKNAPCGEGATIDALVGPPTATHKDIYADTSADRLEPFTARQILISGAVDSIVPPDYAAGYRVKAQAKGAKVETSVIAGAGHFDMVAPETPAWKDIETIIAGQLRLGRFGGQSTNAPKPGPAKPW